MKYKILLPALLLTAILLSGCEGDGTQEQGNKETTEPDVTAQQEMSLPVPEDLVGAASFEAHDMEGNTVSSDIFGESKLTMINVWATYCNPCLREMPALGELAQSYDDEDFRLIGIISDVPEDADQEVIDLAKDLIEQTGASYTHLPINESLYHALLEDVSAVPTTFFFDENGVLLETVVGAMEKSSWEEKINGFLEEK